MQFESPRKVNFNWKNWANSLINYPGNNYYDEPSLILVKQLLCPPAVIMFLSYLLDVVIYDVVGPVLGFPYVSSNYFFLSDLSFPNSQPSRK